MKFSLCYTSRRASQIAGVVERWLTTATRPQDVEFVIAIDSDYAEGLEAAEKAATTRGIRVVANTGGNNCVAGWNTAAAASTGDVLISVADDFDPPQFWDTLLEGCAEKNWWKQDKVVAVADGYNRQLFTLGIITRRRYERFGYFFYCGYESLFSDTELTNVAISEHAVIDARHLLFEHLHPDAGKRPRDEVDDVHASSMRWKRGEMLFEWRRSIGFPIDRGPVAESLAASYADMTYAVCIQAIRDDFCLAEVINRLTGSKGAKIGAVFIFAPDEYWDGKLQSEQDRQELRGAVAQLDRQDLVTIIPQRIAEFRLPGLSRIRVETLARNSALGLIRSLGWKHIIIADGDELWHPRLLGRLTEYVKDAMPAYVYTGMVPVIGLPGYPVVDAVDKATIYVGPSAEFAECRGIFGFPHELPGYDVMHFTATRRTKEEIIAKMYGSGHADDPNYDFKTWVEKVMDNIHPSFTYQWTPTNRGMHMFLKGQIWPCCRFWTPEELRDMPECIKPYLGS